MRIRTALLGASLVLFGLAAIVSMVGGPWNTYGHHTAVTGIAQFLFVASFLPVVRDWRKEKEDL